MMRVRFIFILLSLLVFTFAFANEEESFTDSDELPLTDPITFTVIPEHKEFKNGQPLSVAIKMSLQDGWHTNQKNHNGIVEPLEISWKLPNGFTASKLQSPKPKRFEVETLSSYGHEGETFFLTEITPPKGFSGELSADATIKWFVCSSESCQPGQSQLTYVPSNDTQLATTDLFAKIRETVQPLDDNLLEIADSEQPLENSSIQNAISLPEYSMESVLLAFGFAFIGGFLLNFMPCVLPVISFKILSFVKMAGQKRSTTIQHGLAFFLGVLVSFWLLAGVMLTLQSYGHAIGWGFQLQEPLFVGILAALLLLFSLNFFHLFEFGTSITALAGDMHQKRKKGGPLLSSFFSGILATAIATPCSGPFLGSAIGFAMTLPPILVIALFSILGTGMALPYLLLSAFPSLLPFLPKPGPWMNTFKELMGFVMLSTVLWLAWVFGAQTGYLALMLLLGSLLLLSFAAWIYGRYGALNRHHSTRRLGSIAALSLAMASFYGVGIASTDAALQENHQVAITDDSWEPYSPERVKQLKKEGTPVFIDFTAKWCLICQVNHVVLSNSEVSNSFKERGVVKMKADWTRNDPVITEALRSFGRNAVPLYVLISPDAEKTPMIMPQVLTTEIVLNYLNEL